MTTDSGKHSQLDEGRIQRGNGGQGPRTPKPNVTPKGQGASGSKTRRFEICAEESFFQKLEELAEASGTSKADVIDRAVGLYAHALEQARKGKKMYFKKMYFK